MQHRLIHRLTSALPLVSLAALASGYAAALELKPFGTSVRAVDLHGFASQGFNLLLQPYTPGRLTPSSSCLYRALPKV